ncbi:MAG: DUF4349 domain-containing protein [Roseovarius sp.]
MRSVWTSRLGLFLIGLLIFIVMRLAYGYAVYPNGEPLRQDFIYRQDTSTLNFELSRKNYAGQNAKGGAGSAMPQTLDQRYEKIANIGLTSEQFDEDEARVRSVAEKVGALVQFEQAVGLTGQRRLQLALGVPPESFDDVIVQLRQIGRQVSFQVNKTDKTNEYQSLLARQTSLAKSRDGLIALKQNDADLNALIALERSILDLENQIQDLGVAVGEFDSEFEFVTVKLVISEVPATRLRDIPVVDRIKTALEWGIKWYLRLNLALLAFLGAAYIGLRAKALLKRKIDEA